MTTPVPPITVLIAIIGNAIDPSEAAPIPYNIATAEPDAIAPPFATAAVAIIELAVLPAAIPALVKPIELRIVGTATIPAIPQAAAPSKTSTTSSK